MSARGHEVREVVGARRGRVRGARQLGGAVAPHRVGRVERAVGGGGGQPAGERRPAAGATTESLRFSANDWMAAPQSSLASSCVVSRLTEIAGGPSARAGQVVCRGRDAHALDGFAQAPQRQQGQRGPPASPTSAALRGSLAQGTLQRRGAERRGRDDGRPARLRPPRTLHGPCARQRRSAADNSLPMPTTGCRRAGGSPRAASIVSAAAPRRCARSAGRDEGAYPARMPHVTWIGHGTALVDLDGVRLLTDPLLRDRVAHLRRHAPPAPPADPCARSTRCS